MLAVDIAGKPINRDPEICLGFVKILQFSKF
jgi:hypothetical protein